MPSSDWVRKGECNNCGWCCQMLVKMSVGVEWHPNIEEYFYELRGVQWADQGGKRIGLFQGAFHAPCPQHDTEAKQCRVYDRRPMVCRDFPVNPDQIEGTPCSYWFERVHENGTTEIIGGRSAAPFLMTPVGHVQTA